jgi:hypothetical protein
MTGNSELLNLVTRWEERAALLRDHEVPAAAKGYETAARELQAWLEGRRHELLSLRECAADSGYSEDHVGRLVRTGVLPNYGERHSPRVKRADLDVYRLCKSSTLRKPRSTQNMHGTREQIARAAIIPFTRGNDG